MEIRNLGGSGLRVSTVGIGCNNFSQRSDLETSRKIIHKAIYLGITLFDTADIYAGRRGSMSSPRRRGPITTKRCGGERKDCSSIFLKSMI